MASSRKKATNENIQTYDSAGGKDYTVLAVWESATDIDMVTAAQSEVLEMFKGAHLDVVWLLGGTTDATYFRIMRPAAGQGHSGVPKSDGSCVEVHLVDGYPMSLDEDFSQCQDWVTTISSPTGSTSGFWTGKDGNVVVGCITYDITTGSGSNVGFSISAGASGTAYCIDCLASNVSGSTRFAFKVSTGTTYLYNFTEDGCDSAVRSVSGTTLNSTNCIFPDPLNDSGTHNKTTNRLTAASYRDSANDDFRLDGQDRTAGTDLSADANFPFDDDIHDRVMGAAKSGKKRVGTWDVGFHQFYSRSHTT